MRPFRFGVSVAGFDHGHDWPELARRVEGLGYAVLLLPDHLGDQLAPLPAMMAAASATTTLRVGLFVAAVDFRHPVVLAKEAATVDLLSGGRVELGMGAGWRRSEYEAAGMAFDPASVRVERLAEAIAVVRAHWRGEPFDHHGTYYRVDQLTGRPLPAQRPGPPIFVGGSGPRLLALAGAEADIVGLAPRRRADGRVEPDDIDRAATDRKLGVIGTAAGERMPAIELNLATLAVAVTDRGGERAAVADLAARLSLPVDAAAASPHVLVGSTDHLVDSLRELREQTGISYVTVSEPALDAFAPVVAALAGH